MELQDYIRNIPDFPAAGIQFKDITPLLKDGGALRETIERMARSLDGMQIDVIAAPEARGFLIGVPLACAMGIGFVPTRKPGKLPAKVIRYEYQLEYGSDALEIHEDAISPGQRVAVIDDLLATGGTAKATAKLVESSGGIVAAMRFVIELTELGGRMNLNGYDVDALMTFTV